MGKKGEFYFPPDSEQRKIALLYMQQPFKTSYFIGHLYVTAVLFLGLFFHDALETRELINKDCSFGCWVCNLDGLSSEVYKFVEFESHGDR